MVRKRLLAMLADGEGTVFTIGFAAEEEPTDSAGDPLPAAIDLDRAGPPFEDGPGDGAAALIARTMTDLRRAATMIALLPERKRLFVGITELPGPHRPKSVHLPDSPAWTALRRLDIRRGPGTDWYVEAATDRAAPLGELIGAVLASSTDPPAPAAPKVGLAGRDSTHWSPGPHAVAVPPCEGDAADERPFPDSDLLLHTEPRASFPLREGSLATVARESEAVPADLSDLPTELLPPIDEMTVNPIGFTSDTKHGPARLRYDGGGWTAEAEGAAPVRIPSDGAVTDAEIARLRPFRSVAVDWNSHPGDLGALRAVAGLAAAGIPLTTVTPSPDWAAALGPELLERIDAAVPEALDDLIGRQLHSIATRRIALRDHSQRARWDGLRAARGLPVSQPSVSALLCTRRPDFLEFAIGQIDGQLHSNLEIVLVLHGLDADSPAVKRAVGRTELPVTVVEVPESTVFGEALNSGVRAAGGDYLAKFDDDDWYGPHHLGDLLAAARYSGADLVGSLAELVHLEPLDMTIHRFGMSELRCRHVSGGTMLARVGTIVDVGGFRPLPSAIDVAFMQTLLSARGRIYRMHGMGYVLSRRAEGHTWAQPPSEFLAQAKRQWAGVNLGEAVAAGTPFPCEPARPQTGGRFAPSTG